MAGGIDIQNIHNQKAAGIQEAAGRQNVKASPVRYAEKANKTGQAQAVSFMPGTDHTNDIASDKQKTTKGLMGDLHEGGRSAAHEMDLVMSHMLSKEDYRQAREEGYDPSEIEAGEAVTIVDRVKAELLKGGTVIEGMNDDLSVDQLMQLTGSEAAARQLTQSFHANDIPVNEVNAGEAAKALARASELTGITDNGIAYLIENELTPSVDHLYLAEHAARGENTASAGFYAQQGGYLAARGDAADLGGLSNQIDGVIKAAGLTSQTELAREQAGKLIAAGISLTPAHLNTAVGLAGLSFPLSETEVLAAAANAIATGKQGTEGDLLNTTPLFEQAKDINDRVQTISDDALVVAVQTKEAEGTDPATLTIRDLMQADKAPAAMQKEIANADNTHLMQARLQLEEIRFSMSITTNITLMRSGISIDTTPMRDLIGNLRGALEQNALSLFGGKGMNTEAFSGYSSSFSMSTSVSITVETAVSSYRLFEETNAKASFLRDQMPVGVIGALSDAFKTDTLDDIYTGATSWKVANAAYESMQTEIRRDLGDSIKKAFRNADSLLEDLGVAVNEDSLRAVRILSYNRMEVSLENVSRVTEFDARLNQVLNDLKPAAVLDLIRAGKNPLQMTLEDLSEALTDQSEGRTVNDEKYARFLYKLDKNGEISAEERDSFIGIYRMFETLKKTDHAAIGTLLNTGADMSIKNLLTATRTLKNADGAGIDMRAGDFEEAYIKSGITNAIDMQIDAAFSRYAAQADTAFANIEPEKMKQTGNPEDCMLTEFADAMETLPGDEALNNAFDAEQTTRIREVYTENKNGAIGAGLTDNTADLLTAAGLAVNTANMESLIGLFDSRTRKDGETLWEKVRGLSKQTDASPFDENRNLFTDALGEAQDYVEAYSDMIQTFSGSLQEMRMASGSSYGEFRALSFMNRQLALSSHLAERGSFEIPVEKEGRVISMQVTLTAATTQNSGMTVSYETAEYGFVSASFEITQGSVYGHIATTNGETPQTKRYLEGVREELVAGITAGAAALHADKGTLSLLYGARRGQLEQSLIATQKETLKTGEKTSSEMYLKLAKLFTQAL